jgi:hypothetical protein
MVQYVAAAYPICWDDMGVPATCPTTKHGPGCCCLGWHRHHQQRSLHLLGRSQVQPPPPPKKKNTHTGPVPSGSTSRTYWKGLIIDSMEVRKQSLWCLFHRKKGGSRPKKGTTHLKQYKKVKRWISVSNYVMRLLLLLYWSKLDLKLQIGI